MNRSLIVSCSETFDSLEFGAEPFATKDELNELLNSLYDELLVAPYELDPAPQYIKNVDSQETIITKLLNDEVVELRESTKEDDLVWYVKVINK